MRRTWLVMVVALIFCANRFCAETVGARLQGPVYDPSGAFVPGATIEIRNVEKGGVRALTTDDHGRYREPLLQPGVYEMRVTVSGFQPAVLKGIQLTVGQDAVLDVKLALTGGAEHVNVTADDRSAVGLAPSALSGT